MTSPRSAPPSVLVDASALSSVAARSGIGTYVRNLLAALAPLTSGTGSLTVNALVTRGVSLDPRIGRRPIRRLVTSRARVEVLEHAARVPVEVRRWRGPGEVFHNPSFHAPWGVRSPWVQTLLDVIPLAVDEPDLEPLRKRWRRFGPRYRAADAVIAISRYAADEGVRLLGLDPERVHVAHLGVDPCFSPSPVPAVTDPPYLLVVSEYSRRKGFPEAFAVISALADAGFPHVLKVSGRVHDFAREEVTRLRAEAGRPERIEILGFVDDLPSLYRAASVVLVTSRYEGFGLPALEAMASGVPVVAFANSALREVVDGGGWLVEDGDVAAMVGAVRLVLAHPDLAREWSEKGLQRAAQFTWAESAARHAEVYRSVAEARG
jgi:glycosyltransferase involved in cell wall biosynthesis